MYEDANPECGLIKCPLQSPRRMWSECWPGLLLSWFVFDECTYVDILTGTYNETPPNPVDCYQKIANLGRWLVGEGNWHVILIDNTQPNRIVSWWLHYRWAPASMRTAPAQWKTSFSPKGATELAQGVERSSSPGLSRPPRSSPEGAKHGSKQYLHVRFSWKSRSFHLHDYPIF
jgi:hypothetical protein